MNSKFENRALLPVLDVGGVDAVDVVGVLGAGGAVEGLARVVVLGAGRDCRHRRVVPVDRQINEEVL